MFGRLPCSKMYVQFECFDQSAGYDQQQVDRFRFDSILFLFHLNVVVSGLCVCVCLHNGHNGINDWQEAVELIPLHAMSM